MFTARRTFRERKSTVCHQRTDRTVRNVINQSPVRIGQDLLSPADVEVRTTAIAT
ncbi:hypothetical protein [Nitrospira sp. Nam74]